MNRDSLRLSSERWSYDAFFDIPPSDYPTGVLARVEAYVTERRLETHPYFELALGSRRALQVWLSQELVMTNTFSKIVLRAASCVDNVHVRAALTSVAYGEHGRLRRGAAPRAHPALLDKLRESVGLDVSEVRPYAPTIAFVDRLCDSLGRPLTAIAAIGVGNERLIVPEYSAIWRCFEELYPDSSFAPFLEANLAEDEAHAHLCGVAALQLIRDELDEEEFEQAAIRSIESRWTYFDGLYELARQTEI